MFHNSHSRFHGDRAGLSHTFCRVPNGGGESNKHWLCALQTLFLFQTWYIILLIAQWQVLFPVPSHYHVNFLTWFWQFKQEPHSQCFSAISWGLLFLCLKRLTVQRQEELNRLGARSPNTKGYTQLKSVQTGLVVYPTGIPPYKKKKKKKKAYFIFMKGSQKLQLSSQCTEVLKWQLPLWVCKAVLWEQPDKDTPALPASRLGQRDQELFIAAAAHWSGHAVTEAFARALQKAMWRFISSGFTFYFSVLFAPSSFHWILWFEADYK